MTTYAARVNVHADRYGTKRPMPPRLVVIHTTEGGEGDNAAENLGSFLTRPGDRVTAAGGRYGSSYHAIADTDLRVIPAVHDDRVAFSAPGANTDGLHIVIPGRAGQTYLEWLAGSTRSAITTVAAYIIDKRDEYGIPLRRLTIDQVRAGASGYCDHNTISKAYKRSTHWDVGPHFPWDVLAEEIHLLDAPPIEPPPPPLQGVPDVFQPVHPFRNSDTRAYGGSGMPPFKAHQFGLNPAKIPSDAVAVAFSVTVVNPLTGGWLTVWPDGPLPDTTSASFPPGTTAVTSGLIVGVVDGKFMVHTTAQAHLLFDLVGFWLP